MENNAYSRPLLLLHSCCGPCSTAVIERLYSDYNITVFFYNPNITDTEEYDKRKEAQKKFIRSYNDMIMYKGRSALSTSKSDQNEKSTQAYYDHDAPADAIRFVEGDRNTRVFYEAVKGLEAEPEGGRRCTECFILRLEKTARHALEGGFDRFTTTLSVSPYKDYKRISSIGNDLAERYGIPFVDIDFKKKGGAQRSVQMAKEYGLYRQDHCGCSYARDMQYNRKSCKGD